MGLSVLRRRQSGFCLFLLEGKGTKQGGILGSGGREGKNSLLRFLIIWVKQGPALQDHPPICFPQISILPCSPSPQHSCHDCGGSCHRAGASLECFDAAQILCLSWEDSWRHGGLPSVLDLITTERGWGRMVVCVLGNCVQNCVCVCVSFSAEGSVASINSGQVLGFPNPRLVGTVLYSWRG